VISGNSFTLNAGLITSLMIVDIALEQSNAFLHAFTLSYSAGNNAMTASPSYLNT
jgi:hypothetical protein